MARMRFPGLPGVQKDDLLDKEYNDQNLNTPVPLNISSSFPTSLGKSPESLAKPARPAIPSITRPEKPLDPEGRQERFRKLKGILKSPMAPKPPKLPKL